MESSDELEDLLGWEVIPSPYIQPQPVEDLSVLVKENFYDEPSEHEGLECSESEDGDMHKVQEQDSWLQIPVHMGRQMRVGIGNLRRRIMSATSSFWPCAACRAKIWTFNSVTAFMAAMAFTLVYSRMNRWHKQAMEETKQTLLILLRQQEQKISLLLLQVAHLHEVLSARRRVQVIRTC